MVESDLHRYLKNVGTIWLYNQMCYLVDTEVELNQLGLHRYLELDNKKVIDVVGVCLKYFPWKRRKIQDENYDNFELDKPTRYEIGYNITRGIEVKVSKSDYKNGFICSSTNYNYVLTPAKLISPSILPKGVGLIEYNRYKFDVTENDLEEHSTKRPFNIKGLRVVKRPQYRQLPQFHIDHVISTIGKRRTSKKTEAYRKILDGLTDSELVYCLT